MPKEPAHTRKYALWFYGLLLAIASWGIWLFTYRHPHTPNPNEIVSLVLQFGWIIPMMFLIDAFIPQPSTQWLLGGILFSYDLLFVLDGYLLRRTSYDVLGIIRITMSGGDLSATLQEIEVSTLEAAGLVGALLGIFLAGCCLRRWLPERRLPSYVNWQLAGFAMGLFAVFLGEQAYSRGHADYPGRTTRLPDYLMLVPDGLPTHHVSLARQPDFLMAEQELAQALQTVKPARNPKSVVFLLLESLRPEIIKPDVAPHLSALAAQSARFTEAETEATSTALVWNLLFMNRPPYTFDDDVAATDQRILGSPTLELLKREGYQVGLSISTNTGMKRHDRRFLGRDRQCVDFFYCAFEGKYPGRNAADARAASHAIDWIDRIDPKRPFFLMIQLESTHWPYEFDPSKARYTPYSVGDHMTYFNTPERLRMVYRRYQNALINVDDNWGRVMEKLDAKKLSKDTVFIVVSDHGEQFKNGEISHLTLSPVTRRVPLYIKWPGGPPGGQASPIRISHRNLWPTLFDYLGIDQHLFLGRSVLPPAPGLDGLLTFNGSLSMADLRVGNDIVRLRVHRSRDALGFHPIGIVSPAEQPDPEWRERIDRLPWREKLDQWILREK